MKTVGSSLVSALSLIHLKEFVYKWSYFRVREKHSLFLHTWCHLGRVINMRMLLASKLIAEQGHALCQQVSPTLSDMTFEGSALWDRQLGHKEQCAVGVTLCWHSAWFCSALGTSPGLLLPCSVHCQQSPSRPSAPRPPATPGCSWEGVTPAAIALLLHALAAQLTALPSVQGDGACEIQRRGGPCPHRCPPLKGVAAKSVLPCCAAAGGEMGTTRECAGGPLVHTSSVPCGRHVPMVQPGACSRRHGDHRG